MSAQNIKSMLPPSVGPRMKKLISTMAVAGFLALSGGATSADAATVSYNGKEYQVSTIAGSFLDNQPLLTRQVWWGSESIADLFAGVVGSMLGLPNDGGQTGPRFAYSADRSVVNTISYQANGSSGGGGTTDTGSSSLDEPQTYAVADVAAVPLPAGGLLLLTALGAIILRRRS